MPETLKFKKLKKATIKHYVGKKVPPKYREKYGMIYDKAEAERIAYAIAKSRGMRT